MRFTRIITALLAAFTAALLGLTLAPANATATAGDERAAAASTKHIINGLKAGEIRNSGRFYAKGKAITYLGKKIKLQRKRKGGGWVTIQQKRAKKSNGKFKFTFDDRCGTKFRLVLKASGGYAQTKVGLGKIICY